jgi:hypothetical protein
MTLVNLFSWGKSEQDVIDNLTSDDANLFSEPELALRSSNDYKDLPLGKLNKIYRIKVEVEEILV